ncbi:hypothetical protein D3C85_1892020 [compost metagenome]
MLFLCHVTHYGKASHPIKESAHLRSRSDVVIDIQKFEVSCLEYELCLSHTLLHYGE